MEKPKQTFLAYPTLGTDMTVACHSVGKAGGK